MKFLKYYIIICFIIILTACGRTVKDNEERAIYTNDVVEIHGKTAGLTDNIYKVYVTLFTDFIGDSRIQNNFDRLLKINLAENGLSVEKKIQNAQAVISGSLESYFTSPAERVTNLDGLIYTLTINYSVIDSDKKFLQNDKTIVEDLLVLDTNYYKPDTVLKVVLENAAKHTTEAVINGWQIEYSKMPDKVKFLGVTNETNSYFNRAK